MNEMHRILIPGYCLLVTDYLTDYWLLHRLLTPGYRLLRGRAQREPSTLTGDSAVFVRELCVWADVQIGKPRPGRV